jgi:hypothetical protein
LVVARRRGLAVALAAVLVATLSAGSCAPDDKAETPPPGDDVSYEEPPATPNASDDPRDRRNVVPVPKGTAPRGVEFADADTGYALFTSCVAGQPCQVGLVFTLDGGGSWVARKLPFDDAIDVDMRLGRGNVLIIKAAPAGYFVSRNNGNTFERRPLTPAPVELNLAEPQYSTGCPDVAATDCPDLQPWVIGDDAARRPLPSRPSGNHRYTGLTATTDGTLWLAAQTTATTTVGATGTGSGPLIAAWSSTDRGRTWKSEGSIRASDPATVARPVVAPDGSDVWLVGPRFAARRTGPGAWTEATAMREVGEVFSAEVLPGGAVLIASNQGVWVLDQQQRIRDQAARLIFRLRRLNPQTILGYPAQRSGEIWLCTPKPKACDWSHVAVTAR